MALRSAASLRPEAVMLTPMPYSLLVNSESSFSSPPNQSRSHTRCKHHISYNASFTSRPIAVPFHHQTNLHTIQRQRDSPYQSPTTSFTVILSNMAITITFNHRANHNANCFATESHLLILAMIIQINYTVKRNRKQPMQFAALKKRHTIGAASFNNVMVSRLLFVRYSTHIF